MKYSAADDRFFWMTKGLGRIWLTHLRGPADEAKPPELELDLPAEPDRTAARAAVDADGEDAPLFIPQRRAGAQAQQKGGWLSLFGGRRMEAMDEEPMPQFRNKNAGAAELRTTQSVQPAAEPEQEQDDLEIPSFLRRLAN